MYPSTSEAKVHSEIVHWAVNFILILKIVFDLKCCLKTYLMINKRILRLFSMAKASFEESMKRSLGLRGRPQGRYQDNQRRQEKNDPNMYDLYNHLLHHRYARDPLL